MSQQLAHLLTVGQPSLIHLNVDQKDSVRCPTAVRGWVSGQYLFLDLPSVQGTAVPLVKGAPCAVRFLVEGMACGFSSTILDTGKRQMFFRVEWPAHVEFVKVRKHERVKMQLPCILTEKDGARHEGKVRDLSVGGCKVLSDTALKVGTELSVALTLFEGYVLEKLAAVVRSEAAGESGHALGCQFTQLDDTTRHEIEFFVSMNQERHRGVNTVGSRILLIDRDPESVEALRSLLEPLSDEFTSAPTAIDGLYGLRLALPRVVLVGCDMPDLSGLEICRVIRATRGLEKIPLILYGGADSGLESRARKTGVTHYFPASAPREEIAKAVKSLLEASLNEKPD